MSRACGIVVLLLGVSLLLAPTAYCQSAEEIINDIAEELESNEALTDDASAHLSELQALASSPLNLNSATEEELSRLFFLSEGQIRSLLWYRDRVRVIQTMQELLLVRGIRHSTIYRLIPFVTLSEPDTSFVRRYVKGEAVVRCQTTFPRAKGYASTDTTEAVYAGGPFKKLARLKLEVSQRWSAGLTAETDAGEARAVDFLSGFVSYSHSSHWFNKFVFGHYNLRLGQGLGLWTGFSFDPTIVDISTDKLGNGLTYSMSAAESDYLRGLAMQLLFGKVKTTLFGSMTRQDASVYTATDSSEYIQVISSSGLHRTATEVSHRHNDKLTQAGAYASYDLTNKHFGLGFNNWHTAIPLGKGTSLYRVNAPEGNDIATTHADYRLSLPYLSVYGEVAYQSPGAVGAMQGLVYSCDGTSLCFSGRYFSRSYFAICQQPFMRSSYGSGETGAYLGVKFTPLRWLTLRGSVDGYRLHWLQSSVKSPTVGVKVRGVADIVFNKRASLSLRVRHTEKEQTMTVGNNTASLTDGRNSSFRALYVVSPTKQVTLRSLVEHTRSVEKEVEGKGFLFCQTAKVVSPREVLTLNLSFSYFNTDNYASRVYAREPSILYDMTFGSCYGVGQKVVGMLKIMPIKQLRLWLYASHVRYADREEIGSSYELTEGNSRQTYKVQLQYKIHHRKNAKRYEDTDRRQRSVS